MTTDKLTQPERRFVMELKLGADDRESVIRALNQIVFSLEHEGSIGSVSGGWDSGWVWSLRENPGVTHDSYIEALNAYLEWMRSGSGIR